MENDRLDKHSAMRSIEERTGGESEYIKPTQQEEYARLGHDLYFETNNRLGGLTKEQIEVKNKTINPEMLGRLFPNESSKTDNF